MHSKAITQKAIKLRKSGKTFREINIILDTKIPKSTLSTWFKNTEFTLKQKDIFYEQNLLNLSKARVQAIKKNKERRNDFRKYLIDKNINVVNSIDNDTKKLLLSILYRSEGAKNSSSKFLGLANSDPKIISFYLTILRSCFDIDDTKFRVRIQCRYDQNIKSLERYWRNISGFPRNQFYPTYVDMRTKNHKTLKKSYNGVCTIYYFDTKIQLELELLADSVIEFVSEEITGR